MPDNPVKAPLSLGRRIGATIGIMIMLLTGGCSLWFVASDGSGSLIDAVLIVGGIPFAVGFLIWWLSVYVGRR